MEQTPPIRSRRTEEGRAYRRAYYARNRERILASNKRCRDRRKSFWKKSKVPSRKRRAPEFRHDKTALRCRECGQLMLEKTSTRFGNRHKGGEYRLCFECYPPDTLSSDLPKPPKAFRCLPGYLRHHHLFAYSACLEPSEAPEAEEVSEEAQVAMAAFYTLPDRDREILRERVFNERSLEQVARRQGLTRERIRQLALKAVRRLTWEFERRYLYAEATGKHVLDIDFDAPFAGLKRKAEDSELLYPPGLYNAWFALDVVTLKLVRRFANRLKKPRRGWVAPDQQKAYENKIALEYGKQLKAGQLIVSLPLRRWKVNDTLTETVTDCVVYAPVTEN